MVKHLELAHTRIVCKQNNTHVLCTMRSEGTRMRRYPAVPLMPRKAQAMNDGIEGFVSLAGNQGTTYLEARVTLLVSAGQDGGGIFKVVKDGHFPSNKRSSSFIPIHFHS